MPKKIKEWDDFFKRQDIIGSDLLITTSGGGVFRGPIKCLQRTHGGTFCKIVLDWLAQFNPALMKWILKEAREDVGDFYYTIYTKIGLPKDEGFIIELINNEGEGLFIIPPKISQLKRSEVYDNRKRS